MHEAGRQFVKERGKVACCKDVDNTHFVIIDGLDECLEPDIEEILNSLHTLLSLRKPVIKVFVSPRKFNDLRA